MTNSNTYTGHDIENRVFNDVSNAKKVMLVDANGNPYNAGTGTAYVEYGSVLKGYETQDLDEAGTTSYVGLEDNTGNWCIKKIVDTSVDLTITYANNSNNGTYGDYATAWTNRTSLTYEEIDELTFPAPSVPLPIKIMDSTGKEVLLESNNALPVNIQDQSTDTFEGQFVEVTGSFTLASGLTVDTKTFTATAGHGLSIGNYIALVESGNLFIASVTNVATNTITLDRRSDYSFTTSAFAAKINTNMNVDGSSTNRTFAFNLGVTSTFSVDIVTIRFNILDSDAMDDGKFGGITSLTNGVQCRIKRYNGGSPTYTNLWTVKNNGEMRISIDNSIYSDKAPSGNNSFFSDWKLKDSTGNVIRLAPGDSLELIIQDNLTGLTSFKGIVIGHAVTD